MGLCKNNNKNQKKIISNVKGGSDLNFIIVDHMS